MSKFDAAIECLNHWHRELTDEDDGYDGSFLHAIRVLEAAAKVDNPQGIMEWIDQVFLFAENNRMTGWGNDYTFLETIRNLLDALPDDTDAKGKP